MKCDVCEDSEVIYERFEYICTGCGKVLDDEFIVFENQDSEEMVRKRKKIKTTEDTGTFNNKLFVITKELCYKCDLHFSSIKTIFKKMTINIDKFNVSPYVLCSVLIHLEKPDIDTQTLLDIAGIKIQSFRKVKQLISFKCKQND